jgi:hypothetical protein
MNAEDTPMPTNFGFRYIAWAVWANLITILAVLQGVLATLMLDQDIFSHETFRYIVLGNALLTALVAQIKRNSPPSPPPTKGP